MTSRREGNSAATLDNRIYVVGGDINNPASSDRSENGGFTWTSNSGSTALMPAPKDQHGMVALDGRIYAIGGFRSAPLSSVFAYSAAGNTWSVVASLRTARFGLAAATSGGLIYAIGGRSGAETALNGVEVYDPWSNTWSEAPPLNVARYAPAATTGSDGRIYVIGGQSTDGSVLSSVEVYDPATHLWSLAGSCQFGRYGAAAVTGEDGKLYLLGGVQDGGIITNAVEAFDPEMGTWTLMPPMNTPRVHFGAVLFNGLIYACGGSSPGVGPLATVETYLPNRNPYLQADKTVTVLEDAANTPLALTATDPNLDPLTITVDTVPDSSRGVVRLSGGGAVVVAGQLLSMSQLGGLEFDPATNASGSAGIFRFTARDGQGGINSQSITLEITPVNDPPTVQNDGYTVAEDSLLEVPLPGVKGNDTDPEDDSFVVQPASNPAHGSLTLFGDGSLLYQPNPNYSGPDSFSYRAVDPFNATSAAATVSLEVSAVNDAPTAAGQSVTTAEDTAKSITLSAADPDGDALTYKLVTAPLHGALSGSGGTRTYTPAPDYHGTDSFTFSVNDGTEESGTATVSLTITPVPDAPVATEDAFIVPEDTPTELDLTASDADGDALTFTLVTPPSEGVLIGSGATRVYLPSTNYIGLDSFTFRVSDGARNSNTATVNLLVTPVNDPPLALGGSVTLAEDTPINLVLDASDPDGDLLAYTLVALPAHGTLMGSGATRTYTPAPNYSGEDAFTFRVSDGSTESSPATVTLTISPVNDAPAAASQSLSTPEDTAKAITLSGTDPEGNALGYTLVAGPAHGTVSGSGASRTYTPALNYAGPDQFTFKVNDGALDSSEATVTLTVTPVNDPPAAQSGSFLLEEDTPASLNLAGTDVDGDALTYTVVTLPAHGTLSGNGATRTYTPAPDYSGSDSFTFRVSDGLATSSVATVELTISPANDAPTAFNEAVNILESTVTPLTLSAADPEGDPLTYTLVSAPAHGLLTGTGANRTYTPLKRYRGADSFTFKVSDGRTESNLATVSITVLDVIDPPIALDDDYTTAEDTPLVVSPAGLLENDWDGEGGTLTAVRVTNPAHGALALNADGSFTYVPAADYSGPDSFTYRVREGQTNGSTATVTLTVTPVNDAPASANLAVTLAEDASASVTLSAVDPEGDSIGFTLSSPPAHGVLTGSGPTRTYTPNADFNGTDRFTYQASDGQAMGNLATVTLTVSPANDAPTGAAGPDQTLEATGAATPVTLNGTRSYDSDGDALTYTWSLGATFLGTGAILTTPLPVGQHSVKLTVADPSGATNSDLVAISIRDTTAPTLTLPSELTVPQNGPNGAAVSFTVEATDAVSAVTVTATPASGSIFPLGSTTVSVVATDETGNEKLGSFVVTVVGPTSTAGKLTAKGAILVEGRTAKLTLTAQQTPGKPLKAALRFTDPVSRQTLRSTSITALVISGTKAQVFGQGVLSDRTPIRFVAEAEDLGATPGADRFRLELSDGRVFDAPLRTGSITISR